MEPSGSRRRNQSNRSASGKDLNVSRTDGIVTGRRGWPVEVRDG